MNTSIKTNRFTRQIQFTALLVITGWLISACQSGASKVETQTSPVEGDFAFYRYEVWKGDSLVFNSIKEPGDTAQTFVESVDLHSGNIIMEELMSRLPTMSVRRQHLHSISAQDIRDDCICFGLLTKLIIRPTSRKATSVGLLLRRALVVIKRGDGKVVAGV
jgi:hypothetical protein